MMTFPCNGCVTRRIAVWLLAMTRIIRKNRNYNGSVGRVDNRIIDGSERLCPQFVAKKELQK